MPKAACCIGDEFAPENEGREPARVLKYGESSLHPPKHRFSRPNQGINMKKLFILLTLAAPLVHAGELSCQKDPATNQGIIQNWSCTYQGTDLDAAYHAVRQQKHTGLGKGLPDKLTRQNSTQRWQSDVCDDAGTRDKEVTTIHRTANSLTVSVEGDGACSSGSSTKIRLQRQGGKILIHILKIPIPNPLV